MAKNTENTENIENTVKGTRITSKVRADRAEEILLDVVATNEIDVNKVATYLKEFNPKFQKALNTELREYDGDSLTELNTRAIVRFRSM